MLGREKTEASPSHADCSGCSLCLLVCPVWRRTRTLQFSPHGRAKALQHGAGFAELSESVLACTLCSACEPVCPEGIGLVDMVLDLRRQIPVPPVLSRVLPKLPDLRTGAVSASVRSDCGLLPGTLASAEPALLFRVNALLGSDWDATCGNGVDLALALECGIEISPQWLDRFLSQLRHLKRLVVAEGLLMRHLLQWLPEVKVLSLGEALSRVPVVRLGLRATDLYVIDPRAYHADYQRLVRYYDELQSACGFATNLDLQRIAIPATARGLPALLNGESVHDAAQVKWILKGRRIQRIVVENIDDRAIFMANSDVPVTHLADVAEFLLSDSADS